VGLALEPPSDLKNQSKGKLDFFYLRARDEHTQLVWCDNSGEV
jgi:hypothetical protein